MSRGEKANSLFTPLTSFKNPNPVTVFTTKKAIISVVFVFLISDTLHGYDTATHLVKATVCESCNEDTTSNIFLCIKSD